VAYWEIWRASETGVLEVHDRQGRSRSRDVYLATQQEVDTKPEDKPSSLSIPIYLQLLNQNSSHSIIQHTDPDNLLTSLETMMIGHLERLVPQDCP
jgi:hypothetical protein